jgi:chemotaxis signal transduction protein
VQIDDGLAGLIGHMPQVEEYREALQTLQSVWDSLALLGHLSGTGADMGDTRAAFHGLTGKLLNQLGRETLKKTVFEVQSKAQVAVDIMVRNLFERTADIGFLAMDGEVRDHLRLARGNGDAERLAQSACRLRERFGQYVRKYSVYFNVILLDTQGNVLLQLDEGQAGAQSRDPLLAQSLSTGAAYVETFRRSDLLAGDAPGLIYSSRVTDGDRGAALGVLCLCFRFEDEARKIFTKLGGADDWSVITLLDADGRVIASGDPHHIPVGAVLPRTLDAPWKVLRFAGREYLAATRATGGYQGYGGPGWVGHVMLPLAHAFSQEGCGVAEVSGEVLEAVTGNARLFGAQLREIPGEARQIQRALNRSVWNGSVRQNNAGAPRPSGEGNQLGAGGDAEAGANASFAKVLLWEISNTGFKTQDVFERSIGNLHQTVVSSILRDGQFRAALAIDIMDRNLYERANDCRWWALAPVFREVLAAGGGDDMQAQLRAAADTLAQINGLYTVYDSLVLFDAKGRVVAASNERGQEMVGQVLQSDWAARCLAQDNSQDYVVSAFEATPLYAGRHTYVYAAAVFRPGREGEAAGGIGIVFDSAPQFAAMLNDALPRDEQGKVPPGCFGVFADRQGKVIASTDAQWAPGNQLRLGGEYFELAHGAGHAGIHAINGMHYAVGAGMSSGYREYKGEGDAYRNDVVALIFVPLGEERAGARRAVPNGRCGMRARNSHAARKEGNSREIATFYADGHWVGIPAPLVVEAIEMKAMARAPGTTGGPLSYLMFRDELIPVVGLGAVLGGEGGMLGEEDGARDESHIVVLQLAPRRLLGVMVDDLGEIRDVAQERVEKVAGVIGGDGDYTEGLVRPEEEGAGEGMIVLLSAARLRQRYFPVTH